MARLAHQVMVEAERAFRRADALAAGMEPHLLKRVNDSAIYAYTNERPDRNVPPGDVLLAAALAAGISIDRKIGMTQDARDSEMDDVRSQIAEMREEMANLRAEVTGRHQAAAERAEAPARAGGRQSRARLPATGPGSAVRGGRTPPS